VYSILIVMRPLLSPGRVDGQLVPDGSVRESSLIDLSAVRFAGGRCCQAWFNNSLAILGTPRVIYTQIGPKVSWVNVYIDGKHLKSSPPFQFVWTSSTAGDHQVSVTAYDCTNQPIGTDTVTVDVKP
jgi:hypothetical protein